MLSISTKEDSIIKYMPWSPSRAGTAASCLYKFYKVYGSKTAEEGHALGLGSQVHEFIENAIRNKTTTSEECQTLLGELEGSETAVYSELYDFMPNIVNFLGKLHKFQEANNVKFNIEGKYAMTRCYEEVPFDDPKVWLRGIIDLWAYDEANKRLIIIDHKTNKKADSRRVVYDHTQLNFYVGFLTKLYNLDWEEAHIALHFVRHNKVVWAKVTRARMESFWKMYTQHIMYLEDLVIQAYLNNDWYKRKTHACAWCSFRDECDV